MDVEALWSNFLENIKESISSLTYETWFRDTKLVSIRNNIALVVVPMPVHKKHLLENYKDIIEDKFNNLTGSTFNFDFILEEEWEQMQNEMVEFVKEKEIIKEESNNISSFKQDFGDTNLNKDYTFNNFIVGSSNRDWKSVV